MEEKVYCLERGCPFTECPHNSIRVVMIYSPVAYFDPKKIKGELPEYFFDICKLRIRKWIEEMLD